MANKVLEELRSVCGGTVLFEGPTLVGIVERAIAEAVEEAASQPERQFAEHQARLVKAKADKAEWELYMATEGLRVPSFVELPSESKPLEVYIAGLRFFVNKPTDTVSDGKGNTTMTAAIGVDVQSAEPVRRIFMDEFDANWGKPVAAPGIAESLSADQRKKRDERRDALARIAVELEIDKEAPEWTSYLAAGVDVSQGGPGTMRPTSECGIPADGMVSATVSFDVADGSLAGMRIELPTIPGCNADEALAAMLSRLSSAPSIAESLAADQAAKRDERLKRAIAQQEERRILGLAEDAQDQAERIRAAEERGFYQGRNQAWRLLMETQARHPDTIKVSKAFLADLQRAILYMQKEG